MIFSVLDVAKIPKNTRYVVSRSLKVIKFGINRTGIYDFLLATNSNFGYIAHPCLTDINAIARGDLSPCEYVDEL